MAFIAAKCPECGGAIQLDDVNESGFCMYCGTKVLLSESVPQRVKVEGIQTLENKLKNAETYAKLGEIEKSILLLTQITEDYTSDYRAWWMLAKIKYAYEFFYKEGDAGLIDRINPSKEFKYCSFLVEQESKTPRSDEYSDYSNQIAFNNSESRRKIHETLRGDFRYINHCYQSSSGFEVIDGELYFWEAIQSDDKQQIRMTKSDVSKLKISSIHNGVITFKGYEYYTMSNVSSKAYETFCQKQVDQKLERKAVFAMAIPGTIILVLFIIFIVIFSK